MTPYTASELSRALKDQWDKDSLKRYFKAPEPFDLDMGTHNPFSAWVERELMQPLPQERGSGGAVAQRKGKPSYRQRQKNGRAGRK